MIVRKVLQNKATKQLLVTIPRKECFKAGDIVAIRRCTSKSVREQVTGK